MQQMEDYLPAIPGSPGSAPNNGPDITESEVPSWPSEESTLAECQQRLTYGQAVPHILKRLPETITKAIRKFHYFFLLIAGLAIVLTERRWEVVAVILLIWLFLMLMLVFFSLWHVVPFIRRRNARLMMTRTRFTNTMTFVHSTTGIHNSPLDDYATRHVTENEIAFYHVCNRGEDVVLTRSDIDSDQQWEALRALFAKKTF